jgi:hypothetical protein
MRYLYNTYIHNIHSDKGVFAMKEELLQFVSNLTPAQAEKIIENLPRLISLHAEQVPLYHQEQSLHIQ